VPVYLLRASVSGPSFCIPPSLITAFQQDGRSPLAAAPGAVLSAATLGFSSCS
jgi:hypothetical protein